MTHQEQKTLSKYRVYDTHENMLDNLTVAAFIVDADKGTVLDLNRKAMLLLGKERQELIGMHKNKLLTSSKAKQYYGILTSNDLRSRTNKKTRDYPLIRVSPILSVNGRDIVLYMLHDVEEQRRLEEALQHSEARFRLLAEASFEGIAITENGNYLDVNQAYANMFGYEVSDMIGRSIYEFIAPESHDLTSNHIESGLGEPYEIQCIKKNGARFSTRVCGKDLTLGSRRLRIAAVQDITKIKEIESRLEKSEQKLRVMFESLLEGVIVCNHYGDIEDLNNAAMLLHGFQDKEELLGQKFVYLVAIQDRTRVGMKLTYILEDTIKYQTECRCLRKDNSEFDAELSIVPMDKTESESAFVVVSKDITESRQLRENMQFYISRMTMAQEDERRRIALDLHDDVAQSLLSLNLEFETLCRRTVFSSHGDRQQFDMLQAKIRRTVEDVRYFIQELRPSVLDQFGLIAALEMLTAELRERGIKHSHLKVMGYERRLSLDKELLLFRIAQEAINNVWKHSKATSCLISLSFTSKKLKLLISDNGIGFEVPHSMTVSIKNNRIGIMSMHERAKLLNTSLSIESKLHEGTKVEVICSI